MTDPELNLAIAELIGVTHPMGFAKLRQAVDIFKNRDDQGMAVLTLVKIANYAQDLNEMHRVEELLTDDQCDQYGLHLNNLRVGDPLDEAALDLCDWHATARQRAEAFLRTVGKWKDL